MLTVWTWGKSTLILACRAHFGKKMSIHRQLPEFSSLSSQLSPQPGYSFSCCLPSTKPFHSGAFLELGERTWDCCEGFVTQGFRAQLHNLNSDEYVGRNRFVPMNNNSLSEQGVWPLLSVLLRKQEGKLFLFLTPPPPLYSQRNLLPSHYMCDRCACSACSAPVKSVQPFMYWYFHLTKSS